MCLKMSLENAMIFSFEDDVYRYEFNFNSDRPTFHISIIGKRQNVKYADTYRIKNGKVDIKNDYFPHLTMPLIKYIEKTYKLLAFS
jgi:hypothetical protein